MRTATVVAPRLADRRRECAARVVPGCAVASRAEPPQRAACRRSRPGRSRRVDDLAAAPGQVVRVPQHDPEVVDRAAAGRDNEQQARPSAIAEAAPYSSTKKKSQRPSPDSFTDERACFDVRVDEGPCTHRRWRPGGGAGRRDARGGARCGLHRPNHSIGAAHEGDQVRLAVGGVADGAAQVRAGSSGRSAGCGGGRGNQKRGARMRGPARREHTSGVAATDRRETESGIEVKPVYTADDAAARARAARASSRTRAGRIADMYRGRPWTMRQYAGFASAEESNARYRYLLDARADRPVGRVRPADAARLRLRRSARASARSAGPAWRSTRSPTWRCCSRTFRSARCRRR